MPRKSISRSPSASPPRRARPTTAAQDVPKLASPPRFHDAQDQPQADKEPKLFVGFLAEEATEDDVRNLFSPHGEIVDLFVCRKETGSFAFVTFSSVDEAEKALQCSGTEIHGKQIKVNFAKPKAGGGGDRGKRFNRSQRPPREQFQTKEPKLFIGGLSQQTTDDDIRNIFSTHGEIVDMYVCRKETGSFAFVTFSSIEQAEKAQQCSGTELNGSELRVNFAKPRKNDRSAGDRPQNSRACYKCQQEGHIAKNCPNENAENQNGGKPDRKRGVCFKCQKQGHMARNCPGADQTMLVEDDQPQAAKDEALNHRNHFGSANCQRGQNRTKTYFKNHQEGHNGRQYPGDSEGDRGYGRRQDHRPRENRFYQDQNRRPNRTMYNPFTGNEFCFPSGKEDYINDGPKNNISHNRQSNGYKNSEAMDIQKPFIKKINQQPQERTFQRKRSASKSPGSPKRATRKRSPSGSRSPKVNRSNNQTESMQKESIKQGFQQARQNQISRSRSRSIEKPPVRTNPTPLQSKPAPLRTNPAPARKRSASVESY